MIVPAHVGIHLGDLHVGLLVIVAASALVATLLFGLGVVAYRRRRSRAYLLVAVGLGVLLARPLLGALSVTALVPADTHHALEHGFDVLLLVLFLAAVYYARVPPKGQNGGNA